MSAPRSVLVVALCALALTVAGCGGSADQSSDPQQLLNETFGGEGSVDSGVLNVSFAASSSGKGGGSLEAGLSGPFQARDPDQLPLIDFSGSLRATGAVDNTSFDGGLTLAGDAAFVTIGGQAYEVDEATFTSFSDAFAQSTPQQQDQGEQGAALFDQLGIDPAGWLTDVSNEGTEEVDGVETVHISGTADVSRIVADVEALDPTGNALGAGGSKALSESVRAAGVDVYTGVEDKILRRLDLTLELADGGAGGQVLGLAVSIGVSGVNEEQTIEAPADAEPLEDLIPGGLGGLGALGSDALGGGGLGGGGAAPDSSGGPAPGIDPAYEECVTAATTSQEFAECANLL